jgi:hypothetical protein
MPAPRALPREARAERRALVPVVNPAARQRAVPTTRAPVKPGAAPPAACRAEVLRLAKRAPRAPPVVRAVRVEWVGEAGLRGRSRWRAPAVPLLAVEARWLEAAAERAAAEVDRPACAARFRRRLRPPVQRPATVASRASASFVATKKTSVRTPSSCARRVSTARFCAAAASDAGARTSNVRMSMTARSSARRPTPARTPSSSARTGLAA